MILMADKKNQDHYDKIFETEFYPHADALYTFAYNLSYNDADADDLVQETYLKAYRFISSYHEGTNAKAWLFKILKNAFINHYRKRSKQPNKVDFEDIVNYQNQEEGTNLTGYVDLRQELYQNMMGDEITMAVNSLPVDFRVVIFLCDIEDFSYEEISDMLNLDLKKVKSRLYSGRQMLKDILSDMGDD